MRVDVIWGIKSMEAGLGQQRRGVSLNLVGQSVAVVLPRLLLGMLLKPCRIWAHVSQSQAAPRSRLSGPRKLSDVGKTGWR